MESDELSYTVPATRYGPQVVAKENFYRRETKSSNAGSFCSNVFAITGNSSEIKRTKDKFWTELSRSRDNGTREESRDVFIRCGAICFEQSYNPKVIHTYRGPTETTRVVGFAKGNPLSRESLKTLKQHIPAAHLPHRGRSVRCLHRISRKATLKKSKREKKGGDYGRVEEGEGGECGECGNKRRDSRERPKALCPRLLSVWKEARRCLLVRRSFPIPCEIASTRMQ